MSFGRSCPAPRLRIRSVEPAVRRALQPRLVNRRSLFPARDLRRMLEGEPDVIKPFEQTYAVRRWDLECDVGTPRICNALGGQIDGEWDGAVRRLDALLERLRLPRRQ